jgi:hypothetical protein
MVFILIALCWQEQERKQVRQLLDRDGAFLEDEAVH